MQPKYIIAFPFGGRPLPCDWHLAVRSLILPTNANVRQIYRRSYVKDGNYTIPLEKAQNEMVQDALDMDAEYIMFIEDDTIPPPGALLDLSRVLETNPDVMVCGGIYTTRLNPPEPIVYMGQGQGAFWNWRLGEIFPCWAVGMGCTMIRLEVFKKMEKPWFKELKTIKEVLEYPELFPLAPEQKVGNLGGVSTDMFFYAKLAHAGYKVMAHGGVMAIHWDVEKNIGYWLPKDTPPTKGFKFNGVEFGWTDPAIKQESELCPV